MQITGGELYYFPKFDILKDGEKLYYELFRNISRNSGSEVMIKTRCSKGMSVTEFFGGFGLRESVELQLSAIDADKTFGFSLRNDQKILENSNVFVQIAVFYTDVYGERRLRIFNQSFQVTNNLNIYFKSCNSENFV